MEYPIGVMTDGEKALYREALSKELNECCPRCGKQAMKAIFTWHPLRPYYLTCKSESCNPDQD